MKMFDHLVEDNKLMPVMERHGLKLPEDLVFIREQIVGPPKSDAGQTQKVKQWGVAVGRVGCVPNQTVETTRTFSLCCH